MTLTLVPPTPCDDPAVLCAIPVYNNAATIGDVVRRCLTHITRVLVIDDGSTDADLRDLLTSPGVAVIRHPTNQGKGAALLTAFGYAAERSAKYLITLDGDGQHYPEDIPRFIEHLTPDTILIGYRGEITGVMPHSSRFGREFSDFWIYVETGRLACDTQSGFRAYPVPAVAGLKLTSRFYNFEMEIVTKALWNGMRAGTVPIRVWYPGADARVSSFHPIRDNFRIAILHARLVVRQLLPIPHCKLRVQNSNTSWPLPIALPGCHDSTMSPKPSSSSLATRSKAICFENSGPLGLALVTALSIVMAIVLWPWGFIPIAYVTFRLHLNKIAALAWAALCTAPMLHRLCRTVGNSLIASRSHPHLAWIVGSHLVALPLAAVCAGSIYKVARRISIK
ncbi:MAG TPA: glycosyltransferase family 2 protein [Tepidisphaeraceae bacterium]|jgi:glycosyltransferase involved in cell wall biosynthesis|nr:glycosyltransferase family 2 protein [Tepidisphaeraceae bacterium]